MRPERVGGRARSALDTGREMYVRGMTALGARARALARARGRLTSLLISKWARAGHAHETRAFVNVSPPVYCASFRF